LREFSNKLLREFSNKKSAKNPRKYFLPRAANVTFSKFRAWRGKKETALRAVFETTLRAVLIDQLIWGQRF